MKMDVKQLASAEFIIYHFIGRTEYNGSALMFGFPSLHS